MKSKNIFLGALFILVGTPAAAVVGNILSEPNVVKLISNKTADGTHHKKNFTYTIYFSAGGNVVRKKSDGSIATGEWFMEGDSHCIRWGESVNAKCFPFVDNGDGSISKYKIKPQKKIIITTLSNFRDGNKTAN